MSEEIRPGKYGDASLHSEGDFPDDLPKQAGATHIGMFVVWAVLSGLASEELLEDIGEDMARLTGRETTPGAFLLGTLDGRLSGSDLSEEGNDFAAH